MLELKCFDTLTLLTAVSLTVESSKCVIDVMVVSAETIIYLAINFSFQDLERNE